MVDDLPDEINLKLVKIKTYTKAENPGEPGALYMIDGSNGGFSDWKQVAGPETSWNNDREVIKTNLNLMRGYNDIPTAVVSKHGRLTGKAYADSIEYAFALARECHWKASLGNVTVVNRPCTRQLAKLVGKDIHFENSEFVEKDKYNESTSPPFGYTGDMSSFDWTVKTDVFAAPSFEDGALDILKSKQKEKIRVWELGEFSDFPHDVTLMDGVGQVRPVPDYAKPINREGLRCVTKEEAEPYEIEIMLELARMLRPVGSNGVTLGNGSFKDGKVTTLYCLSDTDMFRSGAVHGVIHAAQDSPLRKELKYMASDGFFPDPDNIKEAGDGGVEAILTPGGGLKEKKVIEVANDYKIAMYFMDERLFAHP